MQVKIEFALPSSKLFLPIRNDFIFVLLILLWTF